MRRTRISGPDQTCSDPRIWTTLSQNFSLMKPLRIGLIGYGFMGRTHSNAFRKVNHFFDLEHQLVLKAIDARNADNA